MKPVERVKYRKKVCVGYNLGEKVGGLHKLLLFYGGDEEDL